MQINTSKYIFVFLLIVLPNLLYSQVKPKTHGRYISRSGDTSLIVMNIGRGMSDPESKFLLEGKNSQVFKELKSRYQSLVEATENTNYLANEVEEAKEELDVPTSSLGFKLSRKNLKFLRNDRAAQAAAKEQKKDKEFSLDELTDLYIKYGEKPSYYVNEIQIDYATASKIADKDVLSRDIKVFDIRRGGNPNGEVWMTVPMKVFNKLNIQTNSSDFDDYKSNPASTQYLDDSDVWDGIDAKNSNKAVKRHADNKAKNDIYSSTTGTKARRKVKNSNVSTDLDSEDEWSSSSNFETNTKTRVINADYNRPIYELSPSNKSDDFLFEGSNSKPSKKKMKKTNDDSFNSPVVIPATNLNKATKSNKRSKVSSTLSNDVFSSNGNNESREPRRSKRNNGSTVSARQVDSRGQVQNDIQRRRPVKTQVVTRTVDNEEMDINTDSDFPSVYDEAESRGIQRGSDRYGGVKVSNKNKKQKIKTTAPAPEKNAKRSVRDIKNRQRNQ